MLNLERKITRLIYNDVTDIQVDMDCLVLCLGCINGSSQIYNVSVYFESDLQVVFAHWQMCAGTYKLGTQIWSIP